MILISEKQVKNITQNYIRYYNSQRPHQGIDKIPENPEQNKTGIIKKDSVLSGLHHHYSGLTI